MRVLMVGDIVGSPGRAAFKEVVARLRATGAVHAVIANAENAAAGSGLTGDLADELFQAGADALTLGDHCWNQKDLEAYIARERRLVRPANFAPGCAGRGWTVVQTSQGALAVLNLLGRVFLPPVDCPFRAADEALKGLTLYPAQIAGVADRLGSLEPGKDATLFAVDGDLLDIRANVTHFWFAGNELSLDTRHTRLYEKYRKR